MYPTNLRPQPSQTLNRRSDPRYYPPPGVNVKFATHPRWEWLRASLSDISYKGACLEAAPDIRTNLIYGDEIRMLFKAHIDPADEESVQAVGRVVRIESLADRQTINITFTDVGPNQRKYLTEMILQMAELKSPGGETTKFRRH